MGILRFSSTMYSPRQNHHKGFKLLWKSFLISLIFMSHFPPKSHQTPLNEKSSDRALLSISENESISPLLFGNGDSVRRDRRTALENSQPTIPASKDSMENTSKDSWEFHSESQEYVGMKDLQTKMNAEAASLMQSNGKVDTSMEGSDDFNRHQQDSLYNAFDAAKSTAITLGLEPGGKDCDNNPNETNKNGKKRKRKCSTSSSRRRKQKSSTKRVENKHDSSELHENKLKTQLFATRQLMDKLNQKWESLHRRRLQHLQEQRRKDRELRRSHKHIDEGTSEDDDSSDSDDSDSDSTEEDLLPKFRVKMPKQKRVRVPVAGLHRSSRHRHRKGSIPQFQHLQTQTGGQLQKITYNTQVSPKGKDQIVILDQNPNQNWPGHTNNLRRNKKTKSSRRRLSPDSFRDHDYDHSEESNHGHWQDSGHGHSQESEPVHSKESKHDHSKDSEDCSSSSSSSESVEHRALPKHKLKIAHKPKPKPTPSSGKNDENLRNNSIKKDDREWILVETTTGKNQETISFNKTLAKNNDTKAHFISRESGEKLKEVQKQNRLETTTFANKIAEKPDNIDVSSISYEDGKPVERRGKNNGKNNGKTDVDKHSLEVVVEENQAIKPKAKEVKESNSQTVTTESTNSHENEKGMD